MYVDFCYGIQTEDLEEGASFVEQAIGQKLEWGEGDQRGGVYYSFKENDIFEIMVLTNRDVQDDEPITEAPLEWRIAMNVSVNDAQCPVIDAINKHPDKFELISRREYPPRKQSDNSSGQDTL